MRVLIPFFIFCFLQSCGVLDSKKEIELKITLPPLESVILPKNEKMIKNSAFFLSSEETLNQKEGLFIPPPSTLSQFDCLMVNVIGEDIPAVDSNEDTPVNPADILAKLSSSLPSDYDSYLGITSEAQKVVPGVPLSFNLRVPKGKNRIIQLIGFKNNFKGLLNGNAFYTSCEGPYVVNGVQKNIFLSAYLISQEKIDYLNAPTTLQLTNQYKSFIQSGGNPYFRTVSKGDGVAFRIYRDNSSVSTTCSDVKNTISMTTSGGGQIFYNLYLANFSSSASQSNVRIVDVFFESDYFSVIQNNTNVPSAHTISGSCNTSFLLESNLNNCDITINFTVPTDGTYESPSAFVVKYKVEANDGSGRFFYGVQKVPVTASPESYLTGSTLPQDGDTCFL